MARLMDIKIYTRFVDFPFQNEMKLKLFFIFLDTNAIIYRFMDR